MVLYANKIVSIFRFLLSFEKVTINFALMCCGGNRNQADAALFLQVVDKHLNILTKQHLETKFVKMNAEKTPFLTEKLKIFMLPTLALVKKGKVVDHVVSALHQKVV